MDSAEIRLELIKLTYPRCMDHPDRAVDAAKVLEAYVTQPEVKTSPVTPKPQNGQGKNGK